MYIFLLIKDRATLHSRRNLRQIRRDPKVCLLRIESGPSWRVCFDLFISSDVLKLLCAQNVKLEVL